MRRVSSDMKSGGRTPGHDSTEDWDAYWAHGFLTSCANAFKGNYEGRIHAAWHEFFAELPDGASILDIATGNGAVALIASEYSLLNDKRFGVYGIDRAHIDPAKAWHGDAAVLAGVTFEGRVSAESLPFEDAFFQAVTGQYALEYTDYSASIGELARVLAPGGAARFILHHPDSVVINTSQEERGHGQLLFEDTHIFDLARALLHRIIAAEGQGQRKALADDPQAQLDRDALNRAAARISDVIERAAEPELLATALGHIGKAFQACSGSRAEGALAILDHAEREVRANLARLDDLLAAVVDDAKMSEIMALLATAGLEASPPKNLYFYNKNNRLLMGSQLDCRRPG